jgi:hypothetical protein
VRGLAYLVVGILLAGCAAPADVSPDGETAGPSTTVATTGVAPEPDPGPEPEPEPEPEPQPDPEPEPGPEPEPEPEPQEPFPVWAAVAQARLRPGVYMDGGCTYNFLFTSPERNYFIGTAGHCTDEVGQRVSFAGKEIGTVVFDSDVSVGADTGVDFTLILLDEGQNLVANPTMMGSAGPSGVAQAADVGLGDRLEHHGYGMVWGDVALTRHREAVLLSYGDNYCAEGAIWWGDSGSPVLHQETQAAIGIISRAGWIECTPFAGAQNVGPTLQYILRATAAGGWPVELATV